MIPLLRRIVVAVFLSLLLATAAVDLLVRAALRDGHRNDLSALMDRGLRRGLHDLAAMPPSARPEAVRALARSLDVSLSLEPAGAPAPMLPHAMPPYAMPPPMPPHAMPPHAMPPPMPPPAMAPPANAMDHDGARPLPPLLLPATAPPTRVTLPIDAHTRLVVMTRPPTTTWTVPPVALIAAVMALVALTTGLVVAVPLTRRIRAIERAVGALADGDFAVRAEGPRDDALGAIAGALDHTAERLDRLFREREELLQAVSHELGTPLSRMRFHLEALRRAVPDDAAAARVRAIDDEIRELDELSSELVSWAEADSARLATTQLDPVASLDTMLELERETTVRPLACVLDAAPDTHLRAERRLFERAVENLVRNAVRHASSAVTVRVRREGAWVSVSVCDDGPGVPESERERVLLPFVRLDRARSRSSGGAGLGLAIARRIVERHGGRIAVDRAPEGGAAFTTWWPAADTASMRPLRA